jgi:hypothetical protein
VCRAETRHAEEPVALAMHRDHHQVHIEQSLFADGIHAIPRDTVVIRIFPQLIQQQ